MQGKSLSIICGALTWLNDQLYQPPSQVTVSEPRDWLEKQHWERIEKERSLKLEERSLLLREKLQRVKNFSVQTQAQKSAKEKSSRKRLLSVELEDKDLKKEVENITPKVSSSRSCEKKRR